MSLSPPAVAILSAVLIVAGVINLGISGGSLPGAVAFAVCLGLGSGINSIAQGSLPVYLFGSDGYGADHGDDGGRQRDGEPWYPCRSVRQRPAWGSRYSVVRRRRGIVETSRNGDELILRRIFSATRSSNFAAFSTRQGPFFAPRRTVTDSHQARSGRLQGDLPHTHEPQCSP